MSDPFNPNKNIEAAAKDLPNKIGKYNIGKLRKKVLLMSRDIDSIIHHNPDFLKSLPGELNTSPLLDGVKYDGLSIQYSCPF